MADSKMVVRIMLICESDVHFGPVANRSPGTAGCKLPPESDRRQNDSRIEPGKAGKSLPLVDLSPKRILPMFLPAVETIRPVDSSLIRPVNSFGVGHQLSAPPKFVAGRVSCGIWYRELV